MAELDLLSDGEAFRTIDCITRRPMKALLSIAMILTTACSSAEKSPIDEAIESQNTIASMYCDHLQSCGVTAPNAIFNGCTGMFWSAEVVAGLRDALERGLAVYSAEAADRCLQAIASDTCPITPSADAGVIDLGLDDQTACLDVFVYQNPGLLQAR